MNLKAIAVIILSSVLFLINPIIIDAAEILQIRDTKTVLIGDQNRNLIIDLYCAEVNEENEKLAYNLLIKNFPRGTKVKLMPLFMSGEKINAKIFRKKDDLEMTQLLVSQDLSGDNCKDI